MKKTFSKEERLCSNRMITKLFSAGNSFYIRPFRVKWLVAKFETGMPVQVLFSVPKYNIRHAVDRNLVRRRIREAYRLNKHLLYDSLARTDTQLALSVTYGSREIEGYPLIESKIILLLQRLIQENEKVTG